MLLPIVPRSLLQEGPLALYKGWLPSVIGVVPYVGLNFAVYESLKAGLLKQYGESGSRQKTLPVVLPASIVMLRSRMLRGSL